jgi:hypothetical protein
MIVCGLYYVAWMYGIPKWRGYRIRAEVTKIEDDGVVSHRLVQVPLAEVELWDVEHDESGKLRSRRVVIQGEKGEASDV